MTDTPESTSPDGVSQILSRFEDAWRAGESPDLAAFLPPKGHPDRGGLLIELVHIDLEYRFKARRSPRVEDYLASYPELGADAAAVRELLLVELHLRRAAEAPPPPGPEVTATRTSRPEGPFPGMSDYEVIEQVGQGGMAVVYRARHLKLNRIVALKMIKEGAHADAHQRLRFLREAETVAKLQHPNVVQIHEVGSHQGNVFLALEFVDGPTLADHCGNRPQDPNWAAGVLEVVARAVHHVHRQGVVHRDLKPGNVMLAGGNTPKVMDFGLARQVDVGQGQTATGVVMGTPAYMAPEQALGEAKRVGPAADVWALGAVLYDLLTGRPPFLGATTFETLQQVVGTEPVPLRQLQPAVPPDLETICLKCLQKDEKKRYASAAELAEDLRRFWSHEPIAARPVGVVERGWRWCRRNMLPAALLGAVALVLLAGTSVATGLLVYAGGQAQRADLAEGRRREKEEAAATEAGLRQEADAHRRKAETNLALVLLSSGSLARLARAAETDPSPEAVATLREAIAVFERLAAGYPDDLEYHEQLALLYLISNRQDKAQETFDKALAASRRAVELGQQRLGQAPQDPERRNALARNWHNLGDLYVARGRAEEAEAAFRQALRLEESLVAEFGAESRYAVDRALTQVLLGRFLFFLRNDVEGALAALLPAMAVLERDLASGHPQPSSRARLTDAHANCAVAYGTRDRFKDALTHWDAALADPTLVGQLRFKYRGSRAYALARLGRHAEAAREAEALVRSTLAPGDRLLYPADALARAVQAVRQDAALPSADRDRLVEDYGKRAVALLRQAADQGAFPTTGDVESLRADPDWAALRDRADFQALMASLSK